MFISLLLLSISIVAVWTQTDCNLRDTDYGSVCVCSSTYCDKVSPIENLQSGQYQLYSTSKDNLGFFSSTGNVSSNGQASVIVTVADTSNTLQTIIGFGGAFTDSVGFNIAKLSEPAQDNLLQSYFGEDGIQYTVGRVPIGGTDFSTRAYTYCDTASEDLTLQCFALQQEDYDYKIPYILKAIDLRGNGSFRLFASPWSSPAWTKSNNAIKGGGTLKAKYYAWWAKYIVKFFDAYKSNNITFWGVTPQNEPFDGILSINIPNLLYTASSMKTWIGDHFGPAIRNSSYNALKIIAHDDNRGVLFVFQNVLSDDKVIEYIDGVGMHWYTNFLFPASTLNLAKSSKKELFILSTEACNGYVRIGELIKAVELGSWSRGVNYINTILDDLEYNVAGWTDWNLALDTEGGPTFIENYVDSPIIVNATADEFYKQPMFYAMGHFSKFVVPDSVRVVSKVSNNKIRAMTFKRPDGKIVVIISNTSDDDLNVQIKIEEISGTINIEADSISTFLYTP